MSDSQFLFKESQRFNQPWLYLLLIGINIITFTSSSISFFPIVITLGITALIYFSQLETQVDRIGIHYRFIPYFNKWKLLEWNEISEAKIRKYNSFKEFGGFGIRINFSGNKAYNTSGNMGLDIKLKNNQNILIGTQKPDELENLIERLKME